MTEEKKVPNADTSNIVPLRGHTTVEVLPASESYANKIHIKVMDLMRRYEETYFALAETLYEVKKDKLYKHLEGKYETFQDYVERGVGVDFRKAKYLTRMWWWFGIEQDADPALLEGAQKVGWCVHPDTLVTTPDGAKPIGSIVIGDLVMDAAGEWVRVLDTMVVPCDDAYKVKAVKCGEIIASEGHGFDVIKGGVRHRKLARLSGRAFDRPVDRVNAEDLRVGDMMIVPRLSRNMPPGEFEGRGEEFFEFAGWYVAEGYTYNGQVRIGLGINAEEERDHLFDLAKRVFSDHSVRKNGSRKTKGFRMTISGHGIDQMFDEWFGVGAYNKRFPTDFYKLSEGETLAFIRGLHGGDGSRSDRGVHIVLTTSRGLAYQTRTLLTRLGILAGVFHEKREGRHDAWIVTVGKGESDDLLGEWGIGTTRKYAHYIEVPGGFAVPIRSIEAVEPDVPLVHLETESGRFCCPMVSYNSKAKELVQVIDKRNASKWFRLAEKMNVMDLGRAARSAKKAADEKKAQRRKERAKAKSQEEERQAREGHPGDDDEGGGEDEMPRPMKQLDPKEPKLAGQVQSTPPEGPDTEGADPPEDIEEEIEKRNAKSKEWHKFSFSIHKDSSQSVKDAIRIAKEVGETESDNHAFSLIALHFCAFYDKNASVVIGEWLAQLERVTGYSLVAVDRREDRVIYGEDFLKGIEEDENERQQGIGDQGDGGDD